MAAATQEVRRAAWACHEGSLPPEERVRAQQMCEQFLHSDAATLLEVGCELCMPVEGAEDVVRFYGMRCIEECISKAWEAYPPETLQSVRARVLKLVLNDLPQTRQAARYVVEKGAALIVSMAERSWPQHWPDFLPHLLHAATQDGHQLAVVLLVVRGLLQDGVEGGRHLTERRRQEVLTGMHMSLGAVVPFVVGSLSGEVGRTAVALESVGLLATWMAPDDFVKSGAPTHLVRLLLTPPAPQLARPAVEAMTALVVRKLKGNDALDIIPALDAFSAGVAGVDYAQGQRDYGLHCALAKLAACVVQQRLVGAEHAVPTDPQLGDVAGSVGRDCQALLHFSSHPSLRLSGPVYGVWPSLVKFPLLTEKGLTPQLHSPLLEACLRRLTRDDDPFDEAGDMLGHALESPTTYFNAVDLDSPTDYANAMGAVMADVARTVRELTTHAPAPTMAFCIRALVDAQGRLSSGGAAEVAARDAAGQRMDAAVRLTEQALVGVKVVSNTEVIELVQQIVQLAAGLHGQHPTQPLASLSALKLLRGGLACLTTVEPPPMAQTALGAVMGSSLGAVFEMVSVSDVKGSPLMSLARRTACQTLISICKQVGGHVLPFADKVTSMVGQLVTGPNTHNFIKVHLYEALAALAVHLQSADQQRQFLAQILAPVLNDLDGMQQLVANPRALITALDLHLPSVSPAALSRRKAMGFALRVVGSTLQQLPAGTVAPDGGAAIDDTCRRVLPVMLGLVRCLHGMSDPQARAWLHPRFAGVLDEAAADLNRKIGFEALAVDGDGSDDSDDESSFVAMQRWVGQAQEQSYRTLGEMVRKGASVFTDARACHLVGEAVVSFLRHREWRHITFIAELVLIPMMTAAPRRVFEEALAQHVGLFVSGSAGAIQEAWRAAADADAPPPPVTAGLQARGEAAVGGSTGGLLMEVAQDKDLRAASRALVALATAVSRPPAAPQLGVPGMGPATSASEGVVADGGVAAAALGSTELGPLVVQTMAQAITWPDSSCSKAALMSIAHYLLPAAVNTSPAMPAMCRPAQQALFNGVLWACVVCMGRPTHADAATDLSNVAVDVFMAGCMAGAHECVAVMQTVAGLQMNEVQALAEGLASVGKDKKRRRLMFRTALQPYLAQAGGGGGRGKIEIPEILHVYRPVHVEPEETLDSDVFFIFD